MIVCVVMQGFVVSKYRTSSTQLQQEGYLYGVSVVGGCLEFLGDGSEGPTSGPIVKQPK